MWNVVGPARFRRCDPGVLREQAQHLWNLVEEELFPAAAGVHAGEDRPEFPWLAGEGPDEIAEATHRANTAIIVLKRRRLSAIMACIEHDVRRYTTR
jgi:hypothetical protein